MVRIDNPHEAGAAALMRNIRAAIGMVGRDEKCIGSANQLVLRRRQTR
jgi:hypothetical protein